MTMRCARRHRAIGRLTSLVLLAAATAAIGSANVLAADGAADGNKTAAPQAKIDAFIETAKPTEDGTVHPMGREVKPRENWFTPCPPDRKVTKQGDCEDLDQESAGRRPAIGPASEKKASRPPVSDRTGQ